VDARACGILKRLSSSVYVVAMGASQATDDAVADLSGDGLHSEEIAG
jgi:hypothetical protein